VLSRRTALWLLGGVARAAAARPNIVMFWSEGHAASDVTAGATPHLQRMAAEGLRMSAAFTPEAMGSPSLSSLLTGLYPLAHGAYEEFSFIGRNAGKTWPLWFQELGYRVTLAGVPAFGPRMQFPFDYQPLSSTGRYLRLRHEKPFCLVVMLPALEDFTGETLDAAAPPPYAVDTPATRKWMGHYRQALRGMDAWIGEALGAIGGNTITLYGSAHGPSLPFAKWSLYDAGIRVPLLVRWPGVVRPGESQAMVSLMDVLPTLVEACGGATPGGLDGRSFLSLLSGRTGEHRTEVFAVHHNRGSVSGSDCPMRAIRTRRFKYIANLKHWNQFGNIWWRGNDGSDSRNPVRRGPDELWREWMQRSVQEDHAQNRISLWRSRPPEEVYDLEADPHELKNLAAEEMPEKAELRARLTAWMKQQRDGWLGFME